MSFSRRAMLSALAGSGSIALAQSFSPGIPDVGFRADNVRERTECGIGALMPWADGLYAITYKASHAMEQAWQTEWMRIREVETEHKGTTLAPACHQEITP